MSKECRSGAEPLLFLAASLAAEIAQGKNAKELFEIGKFLSLVKENLYLLADQRLNWPEPIQRAAKRHAAEQAGAEKKDGGKTEKKDSSP